MELEEQKNTVIDWSHLADTYLDQNLPLGVLAVDAGGNIRVWNRWLEIMSGRSAAQVINRPLPEIIEGEQGQRVFDTLQRVMESGMVMVLAHRFHQYFVPLPPQESHSGFPFMRQSAQIAPLRLEDRIVGAVVLIQDVTEQVIREEELRRQVEEGEALNQNLQIRGKELLLAKEEWERTFDAVPDLIAILDAHHQIIRVNKAMADRLGVSREQTRGLHCFEAVHGLSQPPAFCPHAKLLKTGCSQQVEVYEERLQGFFQITVVPLRDEKGDLLGSVHVAHDISERKQLTDILEQLSYQDGLTGIANRRKFDETLEREWRRAIREKTTLSLIMMDIDFFKKFNDHYGHQAGDECLEAVAHIIKETGNRPGDLAVRYGGEEFALILPNTSLEGAEQLAERIRAAMEERKIDHAASFISRYLTISLGVGAILAGQDSSPEELVRAADQALYRAKREGRNRVAVYGGE